MKPNILAALLTECFFPVQVALFLVIPRAAKQVLYTFVHSALGRCLVTSTVLTRIRIILRPIRCDRRLCRASVLHSRDSASRSFVS